MAVTQRLRFEILKRDNHTCRYCGATAADRAAVAEISDIDDGLG